MCEEATWTISHSEISEGVIRQRTKPRACQAGWWAHSIEPSTSPFRRSHSLFDTDSNSDLQYTLQNLFRPSGHFSLFPPNWENRCGQDLFHIWQKNSRDAWLLYTKSLQIKWKEIFWFSISLGISSWTELNLAHNNNNNKFILGEKVSSSSKIFQCLDKISDALLDKVELQSNIGPSTTTSLIHREEKPSGTSNPAKRKTTVTEVWLIAPTPPGMFY